MNQPPRKIRKVVGIPLFVNSVNLSRAQVCHEMGRSFGCTHENIRPDATNYVLAPTNHIAHEPTNIYWFTIDPTSDPGHRDRVYHLHLTGMLPPLVSNGMVIDGSTQPGFAGRPRIIADSSQILPETFTSDTGLPVYSSRNQVKSISFSGFVWNGLTREPCAVRGCLIFRQDAGSTL